jgi:hypothetical protein
MGLRLPEQGQFRPSQQDRQAFSGQKCRSLLRPSPSNGQDYAGPCIFHTGQQECPCMWMAS